MIWRYLRLKSPVKPADNVAIISLNRNETLEAGTNLTLFGFGLTNGMRPRPAQSLQKASLRSLDEEQCREFVEELGLRKSPGMICTQTDGRSACNGDSGGPLVLGTGSDAKQVGIVSFGVMLCPKGAINVYTNVAHYTDWISENMGQS
ncbi:hypothetical protein TYRP_017054 [Tyrophagus putrescentiae]|nr:hypothetical protein TYRP_017054 [Tyrophagus putrescentiae]